MKNWKVSYNLTLKKEWISMKQLSIKDYSSAYAYKQAKKQAIKQSNALKVERKNKRIFNQ